MTEPTSPAPAIDIEPLRGWIGRDQVSLDRPDAARIATLAAWLDHETPPWPKDALPPLGHWLCFLPLALQSRLSEDGHPPRGELIPPIPLPRRMWAGSTVEFIRPVALDVPLTRRASVADVALKSGGSGSFVRVTLLNEVSDEAGPVLRETQDLVYRAAARPQAAASAEPAAAPEARPFDYARAVTPDPTLLFRFSALTFNAHRIHYDRDYAREVEGYPGLVVHGPMQAMLLADLFARQTGGRQISRFECRARRPLFDAAPFQLKGRATPDGARLWTEDDQGRVCMDAAVTTG